MSTSHLLLRCSLGIVVILCGCSANNFSGNVSSAANSLQPVVTPQALLITGTTTLTVLGATTQLHATEVYSDKSTGDVTSIATWSASVPAAVSVDQAGLATCHAMGSSLLTATFSGTSTIFAVACSLPPTITPQALLISGSVTLTLVGATTQLHATEVYSDKSTGDVTSTATWSASAPAAVSVDQAGLATCHATGSSLLTATFNGTSTSIAVACANQPSTLMVSPTTIAARVGDHIALSAVAADTLGMTLDVRAVSSWIVASSIVQLSPLYTLTCLQSGQTSVNVAYGSLSQSVNITCAPPSMTTPSYYMEQSDDFVGPFPSWTNVKTAFGAVGDGVADDTIALQKAFDHLAADTNSPVIWLPAGTYCISSPLTLTHKRSFSVIGEDPTTTTLKWCGPAGGTMLQTDASSYFRISRLTFDGSGVADTAENLTVLNSTPGGYYSTFNELSDQHIKGVSVGIRLPVDAETAVERVHFDGLSLYGLQTQSFNTLNIFINDSLFTQCGIGVTNEGGAGNFIVSNSYFVGSTTADMQVGNTGYFTARHNTSVASAAFFLADPMGGNPAQITLQNNTVLDPSGIPIMLGNEGPLMLIDNTIRMQNRLLPVVQGSYDSVVAKTIFSFGNTLTVPLQPSTVGASQFQGSYRSYDDSVIAPGEIADVTAPTSVYYPPNLHRTIHELPANATASDLQMMINSAVQQSDHKSAIHVPYGTYHFTTKVTVPEGSDLQLVGDDPDATNLVWDGQSTDSMLQLNSSKVSVKYLHLSMGHGTLVDGISVPVRDQPTTHVMVDEAELQVGNTYSVNFDGIEHANVELFSTYTLGSNTGVSVTGGPYRAAKRGTLGITNFYTGSMQSEADATSFNVSAGGKFMVQDNWHDGGGTSPRNFVLSGSGTVTEQVGQVAMSGRQPFEINDFDGKVTMIGLTFKGGFLTRPGQSLTQLLTLGLLGDNADYLPHSLGTLVANNLLDDYWSKGGIHLPSTDEPSVGWLRGMLAQTRSEYPSPRLPMAAAGSRQRIQRVQVNGFKSAIHIYADQPSSNLYYTLATTGQPLSNGPPRGVACLAEAQDLSIASVGWNLQETGEGDFMLTNATGDQVLGLLGAVGGVTPLGMKSVDGFYDQRWIVLDVGDGRRSFKNRSTGEFLSWIPGACPQLSATDKDDAARWVLSAR